MISTGVAILFNDIVSECMLLNRTTTAKDLTIRLKEINNQLKNSNRLYGYGTTKDSIVLIEYPQIYTSRIRNGETRENPKYLLDIAAICGAIVSFMSQSYECVFVNPSEWKGQVTGDVMTGRILSRLTDDEKQLIPQSRLAHNGIDAIGLGLWACGRL